jgi:cell division protein FtsB
MAQLTGKGAFVVEINKFKQYRIKQLVGSSFKYLTGDLKSEGWAKSADLKGAGEYNHIEIRAANKQYDVLINNNFILSFTEYTYRSGRMGLTAGPGTIARALNFFVYTTPLVASELKDTISTTDETSANKKADTLEVLNNEIKALKAEIRILQQQRSKNTTSRDTATELKSLEEEINRMKKEKEMLQRENKVLREQLEK